MRAGKNPGNWLRRALVVVLFGLAITWIGWRMSGEFGDALSNIASIGMWPFLAAIGLTLLSLLFRAIYNALILDRLASSPFPFGLAITAYLQMQLIRYLPGKVWGLIYQSQRMANVRAPAYVVLANLLQLAVDSFLTLGVLALTAAVIWLSTTWLWGIVPLLIAVEWLHRNPGAEVGLLRLAARFMPRLGIVADHRPRPLLWLGTGLLVAEWVTYLLSFVVLLTRHGSVPQALEMGVSYAGSSLMATAAFVVPAGLAVREAIFLALPAPSGISIGLLATTAVLLRLMQLAAELLAALISTVFHWVQARE